MADVPSEQRVHIGSPHVGQAVLLELEETVTKSLGWLSEQVLLIRKLPPVVNRVVVEGDRSGFRTKHRQQIVVAGGDTVARLVIWQGSLFLKSAAMEGLPLGGGGHFLCKGR